MASIVVAFLLILHFIVQIYAPAVIQPPAANVPKPMFKHSTSQANSSQAAAPDQPAAGWWWFKKQKVKPAAQPITAQPLVAKIPAAPIMPYDLSTIAKKPLEAQPHETQPTASPVMPNDLSAIAKNFYKKHASLLTPGVSKSDFEVQKHLSTGDDGSVYIVRRIKDNAKFALKEMDLTPETNFKELAEQIDIQVQATKDKRTHINNVLAVFFWYVK
ncbi:hypothetical protein DdX_19309 [Ditylenchus destructor]|uniref:Uncharacterized protein n=1 Tax=Ditylenchus destructor TaxID=166010 RepID=A0AAD4QSD7_9BILA|nr:hypothetical protein DdX_19309 [Ditylenchus destructor]